MYTTNVSNRPKETIWTAKPHTLAKIEIVGGYAYRWAKIVGSSFPSIITYIDGFAGPGEYKNFD